MSEKKVLGGGVGGWVGELVGVVMQPMALRIAWHARTGHVHVHVRTTGSYCTKRADWSVRFLVHARGRAT